MHVPGNEIELGEILGGRRLRMTAEQRAYHLWAVGGTGVGKSKLFESMIRQDIANWRKSGCGLMLLDPHGAIFDGVMEWLAEFEGIDRPIVPIDLRRDEWVPAYNLLRDRMDAKSSVIVQSFVDAIAHVWGQPGTDQTPQFARWATYTLATLLANGCTIAEAAQLLSRPELRDVMSEKLTDPIAREAWQEANRFPKEFAAQITSTLNRFQRLTGAELMRAMLGQTEVSLDLGEALNQGQIILVSLATAGGKVSEEDATTFGKLILTDLWTAAKSRGKREGVKPFYLYVDEFQSLVSPTIGKTLDQARGFGLHISIANQYPNQLLNQGDHGKALYDSAIANASTKVVFRTEHPENLSTLAHSLFMGTFDTEQIKHTLYSTKVLDYREEIREDVTEGTSETSGGGSTFSTSESSSSSEGDGDGMSGSFDPDEDRLAAWNQFASSMSGEGHSESHSESDHWATSTSQSVTRRHVLMPVLGKELSSVQFRSIEEQNFLAMQRLFSQEDRHCAVRFVGTFAPIFIRTRNVRRGRAMPPRIERFLQSIYRRWPFYLPMAEALKRLADRQNKLTNDFLAGEDDLPQPRRRLTQ